MQLLRQSKTEDILPISWARATSVDLEIMVPTAYRLQVFNVLVSPEPCGPGNGAIPSLVPQVTGKRGVMRRALRAFYGYLSRSETQNVSQESGIDPSAFLSTSSPNISSQPCGSGDGAIPFFVPEAPRKRSGMPTPLRVFSRYLAWINNSRNIPLESTRDPSLVSFDTLTSSDSFSSPTNDSSSESEAVRTDEQFPIGQKEPSLEQSSQFLAADIDDRLLAAGSSEAPVAGHDHADGSASGLEFQPSNGDAVGHDVAATSLSTQISEHKVSAIISLPSFMDWADEQRNHMPHMPIQGSNQNPRLAVEGVPTRTRPLIEEQNDSVDYSSVRIGSSLLENEEKDENLDAHRREPYLPLRNKNVSLVYKIDHRSVLEGHFNEFSHYLAAYLAKRRRLSFSCS
ncbi:hypothetical protein B0H10DRAFT_1102995 [Mycena sp. CBHHK59/15]|nr:hypothetical protein B0H10DRAFT_1102995 [Mycena sp. CBHHK59/15]